MVACRLMACGVWLVACRNGLENLFRSRGLGRSHTLRATSHTLLTVLLCLLLPAAQALTPTQATLTSAQEARAQAIGRTIRCPVCQGLPITESPSDLSQQMLRDLRGQVAAGRSDEQITDYFASRYGDTVLLDPPRRGVNLLLWLGPLLAFVLGGGWLLGYLRRNRAALPELPEAVDSESDEYLEQVRAEVQGSRKGQA